MCYYSNDGPIITVIMGSTVPIITRSTLGNNGDIITIIDLPNFQMSELLKKKGESKVGINKEWLVLKQALLFEAEFRIIRLISDS